jgi:hypothetical protein
MQPTVMDQGAHVSLQLFWLEEILVSHQASYATVESTSVT